MHTALIFKEQAKVMEPGLREKGLSRTHYSEQHIEEYDICCYNHMNKYTFLNHWDRRQRLLFWSHEYSLHLWLTRTQKTIGNTMTWPGLTHDIGRWLLTFHISSLSNDNEGTYTQEIWADNTQNSRIWRCIHGSWSVGSINNKETIQNTIYASLIVPKMIFSEIQHRLVWIVEVINKSATSIQDLFHNTWLALYPRPQVVVFDNENEFN
jgi:hypothetical protein